MSQDHALFDALGPRARRRTRIASALSATALLALGAMLVVAFANRGQLDPEAWAWLSDGPMLAFLGVGLANTLLCTIAAAALAFPIGLALALLRTSHHRSVQRCAGLWVEVFRTIPLLLAIYFVLAVGPSLGWNPPLFWKLVIPIALCASPVIAEVIRAGLSAIPAGQLDAAAALGMRPRQVSRWVRVPQAVRSMAPALVTQLVAIVKDSTLGYAVSFPELLRQAQNLSAYTGRLIQTTIVAAALFFLLNLTLAHFAERVMARAQHTRTIQQRLASSREPTG